MNSKEARQRLIALSNESIKKFNIKLNPGGGKFIGVTVPNVKLIAKEIAKGNFEEYLSNPLTDYHEEILLYGLVISYLKIDLKEVFVLLEKWMTFVCNWAQCDSVIMNLKEFAKEKNRELVWSFINELNDKALGEYGKRVIILILFRYFLNDEWVHRCIEMLITFDDEKYYVKMCLAWAMCDVLVKYYDLGQEVLDNELLSVWVHNKTISKARDSFRITDENKAYLKSIIR